MAAFPLEIGEVFAERYRIVRCVASGGMGAVYEAVHAVTERRCAIKVMLGHTVQREKLRERFMLESKLAAQIGSEYIVDILDAGVDEKTGSPFLVMELLEGEDLAQRLVRLGRFSPAEAVTYLWHTALALDRTHRAGIVHRDLKASNLFLTQREDGSPLVKVLDFGVAKVMPTEGAHEGHTQTVGTPIYMAPEQFRAGGRVSPATDIYALGMLSYTMLVGTHYWADEHQSCENPFAFASVAVKGPREPPSVRATREGIELPPGYDDWFTRATSRVPGERFASATEAVEELANVAGVSLAQPGAGASATPASVRGALPPVPVAPGQEFVDPRSKHPSGVGVRRPSTGGSLPIPVTFGTDASAPDAGGTPPPERTEISLSVTSGSFDMEGHARQIRRARSRRIAGALAIAAVIGGVVTFRRAAEDPTGTVVSPAPSARTASAATALKDREKQLAPARPEAETKTVEGEKGLPITTLDQLPPVVDPLPPTTPFRPARRPPAPVARSRSAPEATTPAPSPVTKETARELPQPPTPKKAPRESMYSQD